MLLLASAPDERRESDVFKSLDLFARLAGLFFGALCTGVSEPCFEDDAAAPVSCSCALRLPLFKVAV